MSDRKKQISVFIFIFIFILCLMGNSFISYSQGIKGIKKNNSTVVIDGNTYILHTIGKGQTLFAISKIYKCEPGEILKANPQAKNAIRAGQVLKIPVKKASGTSTKPIEIVKKETAPKEIDTARFIYHTVQKGQSIYSITKQYNITNTELRALNQDLENGIQIGQVLKIENNKKAEKRIPIASNKSSNDDFIYHTVQKGQTLYSIIKYYNVENDKLKALNPELKEGLKVGMVLKIPSTKGKSQLNNQDANADINSVSIIQDRDLVLYNTYKGEIKDQYDIAFFLPFQTNEINTDTSSSGVSSNRLSDKTNIALQFYEGALLAIDSLKKQKFNASIYVYDVSDKDSIKMSKGIETTALNKMDLIIGPLYGSSFIPVAKYAKERNIPIVSPLTQSNKILFNNSYVCKAAPSSVTQLEQMAYYVIDSFKNQNIILVNNSNIKEASLYNAFKNTANQKLKSTGQSKDSIKTVPTIEMLEKMLTLTKINVIVLPSNDQSYVSGFVRKLYVLGNKYKIVLFGMQNWINYDNLDFEYLNSLNLYIPCNNFTDYTNLTAEKFALDYYDRFKADPSVYSFQGYDITYYFLSLLQKYGSGFLNNIFENEYKGIGTYFNFMQVDNQTGFENKAIIMLKYENYKLVRAN
ncbi:MAG: LysM peptidoglycan-binding domain-containing protein [Bacteroidia bacterium]